MKKRWFLRSTLVSALSIFLVLPSSADISNKTSGQKFDCLRYVNSQPNIDLPSVIGFLFTGTNQKFVRVDDSSGQLADRKLPLVGCYVEPNLYQDSSSTWQIGVIEQDSQGLLWRNGAGVTWRLALSDDKKSLLTDRSNPYYENGNKFVFDSGRTFEVSESVKKCKISRQGIQPTVSIDFPISSKRIRPIGSPKVLLAVTDFSDSPFEGDPRDLINKVFDPVETRKFFLANSYGLLDFQFTIYPKTIRSEIMYSDARPVRSRYSYQVPYDAISKLPASVWSEKYDSVVILGYGKPEVFGAWASGQESPLAGVPYDFYNPGFAWLGIYEEKDQARLPSWKIFAHELGHLLGLIDLGATQVPDNYWKGGTPGPFDLMGQSPGRANELFGWHRWLLGWIRDDQVICIDLVKSESEVELTSLSRPSKGVKIAVVPVSTNEVLVIESRREGIYDNLAENEGVLVYRIDIRNQYHPTLQPITIIAKKSELLSRPFSPELQDIDRYLQATLRNSDFVESDGVLIESQGNSSGRDFVKIYTNAAADARRVQIDLLRIESQAKAAAEAEAKAKAAAEAEAEAKAAALASAAKNKKTIITCIKGKLTKKVTAVNPKCPKGYKKK